MYLQQQILGGRVGQPQANISANINNSNSPEGLGNMVQIRTGGNIRVGIIGNSTGNATGGDLTLADLLERRGIQMNLFTLLLQNAMKTEPMKDHTTDKQHQLAR